MSKVVDPKQCDSEEWLDEMKVTFDSEELASFFDSFDPLEIIEGYPADPTDA